LINKFSIHAVLCKIGFVAKGKPAVKSYFLFALFRAEWSSRSGVTFGVL